MDCPGVATASRIAAGSILIGVIVLALKAAAWWLTGSAALYSDALETVVNIAASVIAYFALRVAMQPADRDHPFGHAKAEFLAAAVEGALIVAAAASILQHAYVTFGHPAPLDAPWRGVVLNLVATVVNFAWAQVLLRAGRASRSAALTGDGRHLMTDVVTSIGIVIGVACVVLTGLQWLDPAVAALTAIYVLWSGLRLIRQSAGGLMDEALDDATLAQIQAVIRAHGRGALEAHDLRTRHAGQSTFLEFHLVVPGDMRVADSHEICDRIEAAFRREMDHLIVSIHVEPEHKAKGQGVVLIGADGR
jgi:cation diffusion facilitator family transporter